MDSMFLDCDVFNRALGSWNVSNVTNMLRMFSGCHLFNNGGSDTIKDWQPSSCTSMAEMFEFCFAFNQPLNWGVNTANVTTFDRMFFQCTVFDNGGIGGVGAGMDLWDTSGATIMSSMFNSSGFNQYIGSWDVSNVTTFLAMFSTTTAFDQDLGNWTLNSVSNINMFLMFFNSVFNNGAVGGVGTGLDAWNTNKVTNMEKMFESASNFNHTLQSWDTSNVTTMSNMFNLATSFKQLIGAWDTRAVTTAASMLTNSGFTTVEYDDLLKGWPTVVAGSPTRTPHQNGVAFGIGSVQYTLADADVVAGRNYLVTTHSWVITDGGGV